MAKKKATAQPVKEEEVSFEQESAEEEKKEKAKDESHLSLAEKRIAQRDLVRQKLNKDYGKDSSGIASKVVARYTPRISTGSFDVDLAMGGGWPRGRINMVWGSFSGGKTSTMLRSVADAQKRDALTNRYIAWMSPEEQKKALPMQCAWIDVEGSFDRDWAAKMGVNLDALEYTCPASQEEACSMVEAFILSGGYDLVVLDSLAAMASEKEVEGEMGDHNVGVAARLNNKMFRKVQSALNRMAKDNVASVPTFLFINQERHKIGVTYGPTTTKPGGAGQEFFTSVVLHLSGNNVDFYDNEKTMPKSVESRFKIDKNKTWPPKIAGKVRQALVDDPGGLFSAGEIVEATEVMGMAEKLGFYEKVGNSWKMFGQPYKLKKDLASDWVADRARFALLKGVLLTKLLPHQENDWKVYAAEEKEKGSKQPIGSEKAPEAGRQSEDEQPADSDEA